MTCTAVLTALGRAWVHELDRRRPEAGFQGIELFWEDPVYAAKRFGPAALRPSFRQQLGSVDYVTRKG